MKAYDYYRAENLKKLWLTITKAKKIRNIVDDAYYNLCVLGMYWDTYDKLQSIHWIINDLLDDEEINADDLELLHYFIENRCKDL
jgi:hypothetical protein